MKQGMVHEVHLAQLEMVKLIFERQELCVEE